MGRQFQVVEDRTVYQMVDGIFSFHIAVFAPEMNEHEQLVRRSIIFRARSDVHPATRALAKEIAGYEYLRQATMSEIQIWLDTHPEYRDA